MSNELFELWKMYDGPFSLNALRMREKVVHTHSWAIPNHQVIKAIAQWSPIVEIGARLGYWASLIATSGGDIICFDMAAKTFESTYYPVHFGNEKTVEQYPERTLLLCWPPYSTSMADRCLHNYKGTRVIYVGEHNGGCTGDDSFHQQLSDYWNLEKSVDIPQWHGIHDRAFFYTRRNGDRKTRTE